MTPIPPEKPNILVVDDEPQICDLIKLFLDQTSLFGNIVTANSASLALQKIQNQDFDLVIIDYYMPKKKGTDFIQTVRRMIKYRNLKILLISGYLSKANFGKVVNVGVKEVLVKPFNRDKLVKAVCKMLKIPFKSRSF